jgi:hypothetical protein
VLRGNIVKLRTDLGTIATGPRFRSDPWPNGRQRPQIRSSTAIASTRFLRTTVVAAAIVRVPLAQAKGRAEARPWMTILPVG